MPDQSKTKVEYPDSTGTLSITVVDPVDRKWTRRFDGLGRLVAVVEDPGAAAFETTYQYDVLDNLILCNQGGQIREYFYDGLSRLMFERTPEQDATISYGGKNWSASSLYTDSGDVDLTRDARGIETDYIYDTLNRLTNVNYAMGASPPPAQPAGNTIPAAGNVTITYNDTAGSPGRGQVASVTNGMLTESYTYDNFGRVVTTSRTLDGRTTVGSTSIYTTSGQQTGIRYPGFTSTPKQLRFGHDARGRLNLLDKGTWSAGGVFTPATYTTTSPAYVWGVTYGDASNATPLELTEMTLGYAGSPTSGLKETFTYSPTRLQLTGQSVIRKSGGTTLMSLGYTYDTPVGAQNAGQVRGITSTVNATTATDSYVYDAFGRLDSASRVVAGSAQPGFDTIGLYVPATSSWFLDTSLPPNGADYSFTYGAGSEFIPMTGDWDGDGTDTPGLYVRTSGVFLQNENEPGAADVVFNYGPENSTWLPIAGDWNGDGTDSVGLFDPGTRTFYLRNSNSAGNADFAFSFGAGAGLLPIAGDWNNDQVDTIGIYNPADGNFFLKNTHAGGTADLTFQFGAGGGQPVAGDWNGDGTDTIGFMTPTGTWYLRNANAGGAADYTFSFGSGGMPVAGDWDGTPTAGSSWTQDYGYDRWGNRTATDTVLAGGLSTQAVDIEDSGGVPNNRIASVAVNGVPGSAYQYDQNGNVIFDGAFTYVYDSANRLREVRSGSTVIATYAYDAANRRVKQTEGGTVRYSFWEGMHVVTEYTIPVSSGSGGTPTLAAQYVFAGSRMIAYEAPTAVNFTHPDRLSTRMITSSTGSIVGTQAHRPFGETDTSANLNDKHRFTNYERDTASGLDYAMNRHYGSGIGRFSQPDPVAGSPYLPQTLNRYAYVANDPINVIDPLGLSGDEPPKTPSTPTTGQNTEQTGQPELEPDLVLYVEAPPWMEWRVVGKDGPLAEELKCLDLLQSMFGGSTSIIGSFGWDIENGHWKYRGTYPDYYGQLQEGHMTNKMHTYADRLQTSIPRGYIPAGDIEQIGHGGEDDSAGFYYKGLNVTIWVLHVKKPAFTAVGGGKVFIGAGGGKDKGFYQKQGEYHLHYELYSGRLGRDMLRKENKPARKLRELSFVDVFCLGKRP